MAKAGSLLAAVFAALLFPFSLAYAQNGTLKRVWVSGHGADSPSCSSPASPCRSFQYVLDNIVAPNGEIDVLDPAGYGAMTISHAVSIVNDGIGTAGVQASSGNAITINAGDGDVVALRGLNIDGVGTAANGVVFNAGGGLDIVNCVVRHFSGSGLSGNGILIQPHSGRVGFVISNVIATDNEWSAILFAPPTNATSVVTGVIDKFTATKIWNGEGVGLFVDSPTTGGPYNLAIANSNISSYSGGIQITGGANLQVSIDNSSLSGNDTGLYVGGATHVLLGRSMITENATYGVINQTSGNTLYTYGNNQINSNGTDVKNGMNSAATLQ